MGDIEAMYRKAAEVLEARDHASFLYLQKIMADRMDDEGSPNAWILRLDWQTSCKGPYPIFYVEVPEVAESWLRVEELTPGPHTQYARDLHPAAKRLLGKGTMLNRQPFAGFPGFGLRFLGVHSGCRYFWRFSYGAERAESMASGKARRVPWIEKKKWAEDVYSGGYLNLFYERGTVFSWDRWEWRPDGAAPKMGELFGAAVG